MAEEGEKKTPAQRREVEADMRATNPRTLAVGGGGNYGRKRPPPMPGYAGPSQADITAAYQESRRNRQTALDYLRGAGPYNQMFTGGAVGQMLEEMALNPEGFTPEERAAIEDQINRGASNASAARDRALNRQLQRRGLGSSARGAVARAAAGYQSAQSRADQLANVEMQDAAMARQRQQASIQSYLQQLGMEQSARQQGASFMANLSSPVFRGRAEMENQGQQPQSRYEQRLASNNQRQAIRF